MLPGERGMNMRQSDIAACLLAYYSQVFEEEARLSTS